MLYLKFWKVPVSNQVDNFYKFSGKLQEPIQIALVFSILFLNPR